MTLNDEQRAAVESAADNTLVIASPGSGKTAVLAARIAWRIEQGAKPGNIVAITYTNSAARELQERINALLVAPDIAEWDHVPLGFIGTIHAYALRVLQRDGQMVGLPERVGVMDEAQAEELLQETADGLHYKGTRKDLDAAVAQRLAGVKAGTLSPADLVAFEFVNRMLTDGSLSFDAVIAFGTMALECKAAGPLFHELFVDEYQDATDLTHRFCMTLPGTKFFVGDFDQAIMGFAGGNVAYVLGLLSDCEWKTFRLERNYRSMLDICRVANALIGNNRARSKKEIVCTRGGGDPVRFWRFHSEFAELSAIANAIWESGAEASVAVLCRTNALREAATAFFEGAGLSVRRRATRVLPPSWDVVWAFVATVSTPDNDTLAYWWLKKSIGITGANQLKALAARAATSINRYIKMEPIKNLTQIPRILGKFKEIHPEAVALVTGIIAELKATDENVTDGLPELAVALARAGDEVVQDGAGVIVSTVHSFKGCEAGDVYVIGCDDEIWPGPKTGAALEEERRLMFVAATRARNRLTFTTAAFRKQPWEPRPMPATPSRFLAEMGAKL